jgi:hypothetical protein
MPKKQPTQKSRIWQNFNNNILKCSLEFWGIRVLWVCNPLNSKEKLKIFYIFKKKNMERDNKYILSLPRSIGKNPKLDSNFIIP